MIKSAFDAAIELALCARTFLPNRVTGITAAQTYVI